MKLPRLLPQRSSLLVVDCQKGFSELCPDELPAPGALEIVPRINRLLKLSWKRIDASIDWHPPRHCSFHKQRDDVYPPHCVQNTPGAEFLPGLHTHRFHTIWCKGFERDKDAYALTEQHPEFIHLLRAAGVKTVVICGLTTNICCYYSARDLRWAKFNVWLVEDASAGIDVPAMGLYQEQAKEEGEKLGVKYVRTADVIKAAAAR